MNSLIDQNVSLIRDWFNGVRRYPRYLEIYPTNKCNLKCIFCGTVDYTKRNELSDNQWFSILKEANKGGVEDIYLLGGGEPLLRKNLFELILNNFKKKAFFSITTNGTLFTQNLIEGFIKFQWDEIVISIDGYKDIHDTHRGKQGTFEKVEKALGIFKKLKVNNNSKLPLIKIHTVLTNLNFDKLLPLIEFAEKYDISYLELDSLSTLFCEDPLFKSLEVSSASFNLFQDLLNDKYLPKLKSWGIENNYSDFVSPTIVRGGFSENINVEDNLSEKVIGPHCYFPWLRLVINPYGELRVCCVGTDEKNPGTFSESLKHTWFNSHELEKLRKTMKEGVMRSYCKYCPPGLKAENLRIASVLNK